MKEQLTKQLKHMVGGERLGPAYYSFLLVHTCFLIFTHLPAVFINTLLFGQSGELSVVLSYNAAYFISGALTMVLAAYIMKNMSPGIVAVVGIGIYNALILLGANASHFAVLLGIITGFADGFYWLSYGNLISSTTTLPTRDSGLAIVSICCSCVNLVVPLLAGVLISAIGGTNGYIAVFALAFVVSLATGALALRLPRTPAQSDAPPVAYGKVFALLKTEKPLRYALMAQSCKGIREGAFTFILSVVLYQMVKNEMLIGVNTFLGAIAAILSYVLMSHLLTPRNRIRYMTLALCILVFAAGLCLLKLSPLMVIAFTVFNAFFAGFMENPCYTNFLDMLQGTQKAVEHRSELLAINECSLVTGRCIGLVIIYLVSTFFGTSVELQMVSLVVLTLTQVGTILLCKKSRKEKESCGGMGYASENC
ncbi:MAG: MFS transporter [Clostridia bacterium]